MLLRVVPRDVVVAHLWACVRVAAWRDLRYWGSRSLSSSFPMSTALCLVVCTGQSAVFLRRLLIGQTMHSILQILLVNVKEGTAKKTGNPYKISEAHCVLRDEAGVPSAVGVLNVPKSLEAVAVPGTYSAAFALEAPTYGENQGKIVATLCGLTPVPDGYFRKLAPAAAKV